MKLSLSHLTKLSKSLCVIAGLLLCLTICEAQSYNEDETGFYLEFEASQNEYLNNVMSLIADDEELLYDIINELNDYLEIPIPIRILFSDCGEANAFYNPSDNSIVMCHEMVAQAYVIYESMGLEGEDLSIAVANSTFAIMYHEIGHALVDVLDLPITGREEDAVDQFSVVSLLVFEEMGHEALLHIASFWGKMAEYSENSLESLAFYDEHSLSSQRFYDILCLAFGSDTENLSFLVTDGTLPESRAVRCPDEFERIQNAWDMLLEPYIRED